MLESDCVPGTSERRKFLKTISDAPVVELDVLPRLIVLGFDEDQALGEVWGKHKPKIEKLLPGRVLFRGNVRDVRV